jgi:ATP synthase protein I
LAGEFLKIAAIVLLLFAFVRQGAVESWPALLAGLIVALYANVAVAGFLRKI